MVTALPTNHARQNLVNNYVPNYAPSDLKWYERNRLLTYIEQLKYMKFISDPDKYLWNTERINFNRIYQRIKRQEQEYSDKHYQNVQACDMKRMSQKERKKTVRACLRSERKDLFVEKKLSLSHFLGKQNVKLWNIHKIFDLLFSDFKDKFEYESSTFTQKYVFGLEIIRIYQIKKDLLLMLKTVCKL